MSLSNAELLVPGDHQATLLFAVEHFVATCRSAIADRGVFCVALSGGSTPKAIYERICQPPCSEEIEWDKVHLFWSDERDVPPDHLGSNYYMAMKAGFEKMPLPPGHVHRMIAEKEIEHHAKQYEKEMRSVLNHHSFDLIMLGMGEDGHTASLFPETEALKASGRCVVANYVPQKKSWRMTLTLDCINDASAIVFYVAGVSKSKMISHVFTTSPSLPCQLVGTSDHPALWIVDQEATSFMDHEGMRVYP